MSKILTPAVEDYLKTIYHLREESESEALGASGVTTQAIATRLGRSGAVGHGDDQEAGWLGAGAAHALPRRRAFGGREKVALEVIRHHRLSETS
jgi:Mn-dependent DtxR family transcriptional regulator